MSDLCLLTGAGPSPDRLSLHPAAARDWLAQDAGLLSVWGWCWQWSLVPPPFLSCIVCVECSSNVSLDCFLLYAVEVRGLSLPLVAN